MDTQIVAHEDNEVKHYTAWTEAEYQLRKLTAALAYRRYRAAGGTDCSHDWLWENDPELFAAMADRWRLPSSYTCITGGVMFSPVPHRRRRRR